MTQQPGQIRRDSSQSQQPNGIVRSHDAHGSLVRSATYRDGRLDGVELLFDAIGGTLFMLPLALADTLERRELSPELREWFAAHAIVLPDDAPITVAEPEREYLIASIGQCYTLRIEDGALAVAPGRLIRSTRFENDVIVARAHYSGGRPAGERATFDPPGQPLFALDLSFQPALDSGNIKQLQAAFRQHGHTLTSDALIAVEHADHEWRIIGSEGMLSVVRNADRLTVYPGRVVQRAIFVDGTLIETAHYEAGRLNGSLTLFGALGPALFSIERSLRAALDTSAIDQLRRVFQQHGHLLGADATVATVAEGSEWFVTQTGQSYTITCEPTSLAIARGRVLSQSSYGRGKLDGATVLYDEQGVLAQQVCYRNGQLDGPMTLYAAGIKQTTITFQHGRKHGPMIAYDEHGRATMISHYHADQLDGELCLYKEGGLQALATYRGGKQDGRAVTYHAGGQESLVAQYRDGLIDDESVLYNEAGQVIKTSQYRAGKLDGAVIEYYPSGAVRTHATYSADKLDGIVYVYDELGRLKEKTHYRDGEPVGKPEQRSWLQTLTQR